MVGILIWRWYLMVISKINVVNYTTFLFSPILFMAKAFRRLTVKLSTNHLNITICGCSLLDLFSACDVAVPRIYYLMFCFNSPGDNPIFFSGLIPFKF